VCVSESAVWYRGARRALRTKELARCQAEDRDREESSVAAMDHRRYERICVLDARTAVLSHRQIRAITRYKHAAEPLAVGLGTRGPTTRFPYIECRQEHHHDDGENPEPHRGSERGIEVSPSERERERESRCVNGGR